MRQQITFQRRRLSFALGLVAFYMALWDVPGALAGPLAWWVSAGLAATLAAGLVLPAVALALTRAPGPLAALDRLALALMPLAALQLAAPGLALEPLAIAGLLVVGWGLSGWALAGGLLDGWPIRPPRLTHRFHLAAAPDAAWPALALDAARCAPAPFGRLPARTALLAEVPGRHQTCAFVTGGAPCAGHVAITLEPLRDGTVNVALELRLDRMPPRLALRCWLGDELAALATAYEAAARARLARG